MVGAFVGCNGMLGGGLQRDAKSEPLLKGRTLGWLPRSSYFLGDRGTIFTVTSGGPDCEGARKYNVALRTEPDV
jgi:hypothetical protein